MSSLAPAVQSLSSSLALLKSATSILDHTSSPATTSTPSYSHAQSQSNASDRQRLRRILSTQQHFELIPEPQLRAAQESLAGEIGPAISQLLATADKYVDELGRRDEGLRARYELLTGRVSSSTTLTSRAGTGSKTTRPSMGLGGGSSRSDVQAKLLLQKKERLAYAIDRLELQLNQRERELRRKSMAVT